MIQFICIFLPATFSLTQTRKIENNEEVNYFNIVVTYIKWLLINVFFSYLFLFRFSQDRGSTVFLMTPSVSFVLKYLFTSCFLAKTLPYVEMFIKKNVTLEFKLKRKSNE